MYLFCELCHRQPSVESGRFQFSTCCHIFCRKCSTDSGTCAVCGQSCQILQIHKTTLPDSAKEYLVPYKDKLLKLIKVNKFQMQKRNTFIVPNQQLIERYEEKKQKIKKLNETYESFKTVVREEEELIRKLCNRKKVLKAKHMERMASNGSLNWEWTTPRTVVPNAMGSQFSTPRHVAADVFSTPGTGVAQTTIPASTTSAYTAQQTSSASVGMSGVKRLPQMHSSGSSGYLSMEMSSSNFLEMHAQQKIPATTGCFPDLQKRSDSAGTSGMNRRSPMHTSGSSGYHSKETSSNFLQMRPQQTIPATTGSYPEFPKRSDSTGTSGMKRRSPMHHSGSSGYHSKETSSNSPQTQTGPRSMSKSSAVSVSAGKRLRSPVEDFMQQTDIDSATRDSVYEQTFQSLADAIYPAKQTQIKVCHKNNVERGRNVIFD